MRLRKRKMKPALCVVAALLAIAQTPIGIDASTGPTRSGSVGSSMTDSPEPRSTHECLSGVATLDEWGTFIVSLGVAVHENALRTQVRTTIAQLAMFDAVNAVLDGNFEPFASKPEAAPGASPEAAAIRAAYIVALH